MSTVNLNKIVTCSNSALGSFSKGLDAFLDLVDRQGMRKAVVVVISFVRRSYNFPTSFAFRNVLATKSSSRNIR